MTSILNNVAANTALLNLQSTVKNLQNLQNQISTGLRVSSAADNASYFSIASVLRTDSNALSAVSDTLNQGNSSLSVAATAIAQIQTTLSDIKNQLITASKPNADRTVIQQQISQDQKQLENIANSANLNGQNFLSVDSNSHGYNSTKSFVSSYSRDSHGSISVGYISINTKNSAILDAGNDLSIQTTLNSGTTAEDLPTTGPALTAPNATLSYEATATAGPNGAQSFSMYTLDSASDPAAPKYFKNTIGFAASGTTPLAVTVTQGAGTSALAVGDTIGGVATGAPGGPTGVKAPEYDAATQKLTFWVINPGQNPVAGKSASTVSYDKVEVDGFTPVTSNGILDRIDTVTKGSYTDTSGNTTWTTSALSSGGVGTGVSILDMNIAGLTDGPEDMAMLNAYQQQVDNAISSVTSAASTLGTAQSRIQAQTSFVTSLQTSIDNGVGSMVDSDLNVASTRLQALQVQQQLGVQSLSMANQSTQMILKLFQ
jgi:flagellin